MVEFNENGFKGAKLDYIGPRLGKPAITVVLYGEGFVGDNVVWDNKKGMKRRGVPRGTPGSLFEFRCNAFDLSDGKLKVLSGSWGLMQEIKNYPKTVGVALTLEQKTKGVYTLSHRPLTEAEAKAAKSIDKLRTFDNTTQDAAPAQAATEDTAGDEVPF